MQYKKVIILSKMNENWINSLKDTPNIKDLNGLGIVEYKANDEIKDKKDIDSLLSAIKADEITKGDSLSTYLSKLKTKYIDKITK